MTMPPNSHDDDGPSDRDLIGRMLAGDRDAINMISKQALERLKVDIARRLPSRMRRHADEDDLANSVMKSFFHGVAGDRFPRLEDENDLWQILGMLTRQKLAKYTRRASAQKRGSGSVRGESVFGNADEYGNQGFDAFPGDGDSPLKKLTQLEDMDAYLQMLPDERMREIALWKLDGCDNKEIAARQETSVRTIGRKLQLIRKCWSGFVETNTH